MTWGEVCSVHSCFLIVVLEKHFLPFILAPALTSWVAPEFVIPCLDYSLRASQFLAGLKAVWGKSNDQRSLRQKVSRQSKASSPA